MTRSFLHLASATVLAMLLTACGSSVNLKDVPVETRTPSAGAGAGAAGTTPQSQVATVQAAAPASGGIDAALAATGRVVYFDFDSFVVREDGKPVVDAHAKALVANRGRKMVVEGHTDERGGREYNLALGQKRAMAVVKALTLLGAADVQLEAVSYGEERPAAAGSDEAAWAKNRRAELKDAK
jgi:peptidoglycan-associated lipoprotein